MGIEATMFSITWTDSKEDHHMPHRHKQKTFTCDRAVREQRDSKDHTMQYGPKHSVLGSIEVNWHQTTKPLGQKASQSFSG